MLGLQQRHGRRGKERRNHAQIVQRNLAGAVAALAVLQLVAGENQHQRAHLGRQLDALVLFEPVGGGGNRNRKADALHLPQIVGAFGQNLRLAHRAGRGAVADVGTGEHQVLFFVLNHAVHQRLIVAVIGQGHQPLIVFDGMDLIKMELFAQLAVFVAAHDLLERAALRFHGVLGVVVDFCQRNVSEPDAEVGKRHGFNILSWVLFLFFAVRSSGGAYPKHFTTAPAVLQAFCGKSNNCLKDSHELQRLMASSMLPPTIRPIASQQRSATSCSVLSSSFENGDVTQSARS